MLGTDTVDEELERGFGLTVERLEPFLRVDGNAAEMKFMECCRYLWQADGAELTEPFIDALFNALPDKSRCILFQRMLTIVLRCTRCRANTSIVRRRPAGAWNYRPGRE